MRRLQVPEPREICSAPGEVVVVLPAAAAAHHRRRATATESRGDAARAATVFKDNARLQLLVAPEVRPEEGFLLSSDQRGSHQVSRQEQGPPVPADGGQIVQIATGTKLV